jgi:putative aldouronate transport system substrate-binding protein
MLKKLIQALCVLSAVGMASCSRPQAAASTAGPDPISLAVTVHSSQSPVDWNGKMGTWIRERTNTVVSAEFWPEDAANEKRNLALASGSLPDFLHVSRDQANAYGLEGVFEPLDDLLKQYAPDLLSRMTPANSASLRNPADGKIYMIPIYYGLNELTEWTFDYRLDILEEMGEPEPSTMEEWYQLFKKVKARYPDMIPLVERNRGVDAFTHAAFDMGKIDRYYGIIGSDYDKRQIVYLPITNEWRDMLQYYNRLYREGLMDPEYLTIQYNDWWEGKIGAGRAFACWTMNFSRADQANQLGADAGISLKWRTATTVKNYKTGERVQYKTGNPWQEAGFALSAKSTHKEAAVRFLNFFYSTEYLLHPFILGGEGVSYIRDGYTFSKLLPEFDENKFIGADGFFYFPQFKPYIIAYNMDPPMLATIDHFEKNSQYVKIIPTISRSGDNLERWIAITTDLNGTVNTYMDEFITGRRPFSEWDAYVAAIKALGSDEGVVEVQKWYDDYFKMSGL